MTAPTMPVIGIAIDAASGKYVVFIGADEQIVDSRAEANTILDDFTDQWYAMFGATYPQRGTAA
jgi:glycosyltransferase involved in cell wall biosynthesis